MSEKTETPSPTSKEPIFEFHIKIGSDVVKAVDGISSRAKSIIANLIGQAASLADSVKQKVEKDDGKQAKQTIVNVLGKIGVKAVQFGDQTVTPEKKEEVKP